MNVIPIYKSHYSLGKSILTLDKPKGNLEEYPISIFDLVLHSKQDFLCLIDDNMTGFLEASRNCQDNKLKLIFGLRIDVTNSIENQDEKSLSNRAKYIIFAKNNSGYQSLIKIWSFAAKDGFYYNPCIDFPNLKRLWSSDLTLAVPFYDSFLYLNSMEGHFHIPDFEKFKPVFLLENNGIPFDFHLRKKTKDYCAEHKYETLEAQSIYYKSRLDFIAYLTFRCISERRTIEKPELNHMCSDSFNFEDWYRKEQEK